MFIISVFAKPGTHGVMQTLTKLKRIHMKTNLIIGLNVKLSDELVNRANPETNIS